MSTVAVPTSKARTNWNPLIWFAALVVACYAPVLWALVNDWLTDADMGHGFFVPVIAGYILWQKREQLLALDPEPCPWGLLVVLYGAAQLLVGTLGVELFLSRTAFVITLIGAVWYLRGTETVKKAAFPLSLLFLMIPIPAIIYSRITFPLQIIASQFAAASLDVLNVPIQREGNVLVLPNQTLQVVEACSGIRSLLSLTFLSLVYGYFFEKRTWVRVALFASTIPIAIIANGSRVTVTGVMTQIKPELAEGFFHESTGWVIFLVAMAILILFHRVLAGLIAFRERRRATA